MQVVDSVPVEFGGGVKLEDIILPRCQGLEAEIGEGHFEGVFDLAFDLLLESAQVVGHLIEFFVVVLFPCIHA